MQHQNQEADIGVIVLTRYRTYLDFLSFYMSLCVYVYVCVVLFSLILCMDLCNHRSQDSTAPAPQTDPSCCPVRVVPTSSLSSGDHYPGIHLRSFFILRMLYKWRHTVGNLLRWAFSTNTVPMRSIQVVMCNSSLFLFITEQYSTVWLCQTSFDHLPDEGHLCCFQFGAIIDKAIIAMNIHRQVLCECKFSFLWYKCPRGKFLGLMVSACLAYKKLPKCLSE